MLGVCVHRLSSHLNRKKSNLICLSKLFCSKYNCFVVFVTKLRNMKIFTHFVNILQFKLYTKLEKQKELLFELILSMKW